MNTIDRDFLIDKLRTGDVTVRFVKAEGVVRMMKCTLREDVTSQYERKTDGDSAPSTPNEDNVRVWDLEKSAWRTFKMSSIISVEC